MSVRVRFAPSPTGYLHVGGLRTALYNYLFAKQQKGSLILRIEDTDRTRLVADAQENLIKSLRWAGIEFDEGPRVGGDFGPYVQSDRLATYKYCAEQLIDHGKAYYAFDTAEELTEMRNRQQESGKTMKYDRNTMRNQYTLGVIEAMELVDQGVDYVIRLKVPEDYDVKFIDMIRGEVVVNSKEIDDQVLLKSDGFPTYHLANVVDDHNMAIDHVIRGEEWLPSTPKHILLYEAFNWKAPKFAHLPLLLNSKKQKLSKRHGDVAVEDFMNKGYTPEAFVNFIALLGWNPSGDREIYSIDELISSFKLEKVNKGGAFFDTQKLEWMNAQYMKILPEDLLMSRLKNILKEKGITNNLTQTYIKKVLELFKERIHFLKELPEIADYMFDDPKEYDENYYKKHWTENTLELIKPLIDILRNDKNFTHASTHNLTMKYVEDNDIKLKVLIHPLRLMITGKSSGAGMFETMAVLGKDKCLERIDRFISKVENGEI